MKNKALSFKLFSFLILALMLMSLVSCSKVDETDLDTLETLAVSTVEVIKKRDVDTAYELVDKEYYDKVSIEEMIPKYSDYIGAFNSFEIKERKGYSSKSIGGETLVMAAFLVDTDAEDFYITVSASKGDNKLRGLSLSLEKDMEPTYTGSISTMKGANVLQWAVLVLGLFSMAFSFWMLLDCAKSKISKKPVWIIFILISFLLVRLTFEPGKSIKLLFWIAFIVNSATLKYYSDGKVIMELILPIGAIVYFFVRRKLKVKARLKQRTAEALFTEPKSTSTLESTDVNASEEKKCDREETTENLFDMQDGNREDK